MIFPISFATVILFEKDMVEYTDETGYFEFTNLTEGDYSLRVESEGYLAKEILFSLRKDKILEISLIENVVNMAPIIVKAGTSEEIPVETVYSKEEIENTPLFSDPFNVVERDSDIVSVNSILYGGAFLNSDWSASNVFNRVSTNQVSVDGSDPDWNSYYLGNIQLPYLMHTTGSFQRSVIPLEIIESVKTYKGTSPFRYGPGIGGTFIAEAYNLIPDENLLRVNASTEYMDLYSQFSLGNDLGFYLSVRHSIFHLTNHYFSVNDENYYLYPPLGEEVLKENSDQNGDFFLRFIYTPPSNRFSLTAIGFYDNYYSYWGSEVLFDAEGNILMIGTSVPGIMENKSQAGIVSFSWLSSASSSLVNLLCLNGTVFSVGNHETIWDEVDSDFIPSRYTDISDVSVNLTDEVNFIFTDELQIQFGTKLLYSDVAASYQTWKSWSSEQTFNYDSSDNPVFYYEGIYEDYDSFTEFHYIYDENGLPILATGALHSYNDDFLYSGNFDHLFPSVYSNFDLDLGEINFSGGFGYHFYIDKSEYAGYPAVEIKLDYLISDKMRSGIISGFSPGRFSELVLAGRKMNELYYNLDADTSFINPPIGLNLKPYFEYVEYDFFKFEVEPYFNWFYNLSGFSIQTNFKDTLDFSSTSYTILEPSQALSFGCSITNTYKLNDWLFNRLAYNISWALYETEESGWIYANTDIRHIIKDTFYCTPGWGLTIGATLGVFIGTAFTPYTLVSVDPEITVAGDINSGRDWVPKWLLNAQIKKEFAIGLADIELFMNLRDILKFIPQNLKGFNADAETGDSTAGYENRYYEASQELASAFELVEFGFSVKYTF